jgi:hypothetical protein
MIRLKYRKMPSDISLLESQTKNAKNKDFYFQGYYYLHYGTFYFEKKLSDVQNCLLGCTAV